MPGNRDSGFDSVSPTCFPVIKMTGFRSDIGFSEKTIAKLSRKIGGKETEIPVHHKRRSTTTKTMSVFD
jgi:hypothetical protein